MICVSEGALLCVCVCVVMLAYVYKVKLVTLPILADFMNFRTLFCVGGEISLEGRAVLLNGNLPPLPLKREWPSITQPPR